jgi:iron(II)-dependent oxidoreductase
MGHKKRDMANVVNQVKLKPLLGMKPGLYLSILYLIIVLLFIFFVAFLPGIINSGKRVTFVSKTKPAVIFLNDSYVGSTEATQFLKPGNYTVTFSFENELSESVNFNVKRAVFLTWLFPRKQIVASESLIKDKPTFRYYLEKMFDQVVYWSAFLGDDNFHRPLLFEQVAFSSLNSTYKDSSLLFEFYKNSLLFIESETQLKEFKSALNILNDAVFFNEEHQQELNSLISKVELLFINSDKQIKSTIANKINFTKGNNFYSFEAGLYNIGEDVLLNYPAVNKMGIQKKVDAFRISETLVSEYQWYLFVKANPYWDKSNLDQLIKDKMVDENYLAGVFLTDAIQSNKAIRNISYNAAVAYTEYLTKLEPNNYFIPTAEQLELAFSSAAALKTFDNLWEFSSSTYTPLLRYLDYPSTYQSDFVEIIVKESSNPTSIGILEKYESSEHASLRVAWSN